MWPFSLYNYGRRPDDLTWWDRHYLAFDIRIAGREVYKSRCGLVNSRPLALPFSKLPYLPPFRTPSQTTNLASPCRNLHFSQFSDLLSTPPKLLPLFLLCLSLILFFLSGSCYLAPHPFLASRKRFLQFFRHLSTPLKQFLQMTEQ